MSNNKYSALWITGICIVVFILQIIFPIITDIFKLTTSEVITHPWTLITAIFLHGSIVHLLYNMFALALFGTILENYIGTKRFLSIFFLSGLLASLASIPFYNAVLGASGAIFGIIGALAVLKPKMVVWIYYIPMPMFVVAIIYAAIDILGVFVPSNVANIAHLSGIVVGIVFAFILRTKYKKQVTKKESETIDDKSLEEWEEKYMR